MTIIQILVVVLAGPIGVICFGNFLAFLIFKEVKLYSSHVVMLVFCIVAILLSFIGIQ